MGLPRTSANACSARGGVHVPRPEQQWREEVAEHEPCPLVELAAEVRLRVGDALPPALGVIGLHADQDAALVGHLAEAGPEGPDERQLDEEAARPREPGHGVPSGTRTYADLSRSKAPTIEAGVEARLRGLGGGVTPARRELGVPRRSSPCSRGTSTIASLGRGRRPSTLAPARRDHPRPRAPSGALRTGPRRRCRIEIPSDHEPIGTIASIDLVRHLPVEGPPEAVGDGAELPEVEPRVPRHERIERPPRDVDVLIERLGPLTELERVPDTPMALAPAAPRACASGRGARLRPPPPIRGRTRPSAPRRRPPAGRCRCARARSSPLGEEAGTRPTWPP